MPPATSVAFPARANSDPLVPWFVSPFILTVNGTWPEGQVTNLPKIDILALFFGVAIVAAVKTTGPLAVHLRDVPTVESDGRELDLVSVTASTTVDSALVSLSNLDIGDPVEVVLDLRGRAARCGGARILTAPTPAAHNTPRNPSAVAPVAFDAVREHPRGLLVELPPHSYVTAELQLT